MNLGKFISNFISTNKLLFIKSFTLFQSLFVLFYISSERIYESRTDIMPSSSSSSQLLISAFTGGFPTGGLQSYSKSANVYSSIVKSKSFSKALFEKEIIINNETITVYDFIKREYDKSGENPEIEFERTYRFFKNSLISVRYNKLTDIVTIQTFTTDPYFSHELLKASLIELESRLKKYFIENAASKKDFILNRISNVENELIEIEDKYIAFLNQNSSIQSPSLLVSRKRLEREMSVKENILIELSAELEVHKLEVTRDNQVVVDIIDDPSLNLLKVYPRFWSFLMMSLIASFIAPFILKSKSFFIDN